MKLDRAMRRDNKRSKRQKHVVDGKSIFILEEEKRKKAEKIKREREEKEKLVEENS